MRKILLDTNAYARLLSKEEAVLDALSFAETVYMSVFVLGELYSGFSGGKQEQTNRDLLNHFLLKSTVKILNATSETAEIFGFIKNNLKKAGTPIPINDVWISAHVLETGSVLITYDQHFNKVEGLRVWGKT